VIFLGEKYSIMTIIAFMFIFVAIITAETGFAWLFKSSPKPE